jgi:hypothetical protein
MTNRRASKAASLAPQTSLRRLLTVLFVLTGFLFQSYAVQTHIHVANDFDARLISAHSVDKAPSIAKTLAAKPSRQQQHKKIPADDPSNCPLCQASFLSGQYVMPDAVVFLLPVQALAIVPATILLTARSSVASHIWQGRAPPRS